MLIDRIPEIVWPALSGLSVGVIFVSLDVVSKLFGMAGVVVSVSVTLYKVWKDHQLKQELEEIKAARAAKSAELDERLEKIERELNG